MNKLVKIMQLTAISYFVMAYAGADEVNFGKAPPSDAAIIAHFKTATTLHEADSVVNYGDSYHDVSEGELHQVRGLVKEPSFNKIVEKTKTKSIQPEKAISLEIMFDYN
ncbi:MAG: hypothetical protein NTX38_17930 [Methylobacter sp.]|nr:hypothetical protein [Methylobacter sp.]